jgi:hypothetical protein
LLIGLSRAWEKLMINLWELFRVRLNIWAKLLEFLNIHIKYLPKS